MSGQPARTHEDIEAQITAIQAKRAQQGDQEDVPKENERIGLTETGVFDQDIYGGKGKFEGYVTSIASKEDEEDDDEAAAPEKGKRLPNYTAPQAVLKDMEKGQEDDFDPFAEHKIPTIASRDSEYTRRRLQQQAATRQRLRSPRTRWPPSRCSATLRRSPQSWAANVRQRPKPLKCRIQEPCSPFLGLAIRPRSPMTR